MKNLNQVNMPIARAVEASAGWLIKIDRYIATCIMLFFFFLSHSQTDYFVRSQSSLLANYQGVEAYSALGLPNGKIVVQYRGKRFTSNYDGYFITYDSDGMAIKEQRLPIFSFDLFTRNYVTFGQNILIGNASFGNGISLLTNFNTFGNIQVIDTLSLGPFRLAEKINDSCFIALAPIQSSSNQSRVGLFNKNDSNVWSKSLASFITDPRLPSSNSPYRIADMSHYGDSLFLLLSADYDSLVFMAKANVHNGELGSLHQLPRGTGGFNVKLGKVITLLYEWPRSYFGVNGKTTALGSFRVYDLNLNLLDSIDPKMDLAHNQWLLTRHWTVDTLSGDLCLLFGQDTTGSISYPNFTRVGVLRYDKNGTLIQKSFAKSNGLANRVTSLTCLDDSSLVFTLAEDIGFYAGIDASVVKVGRTVGNISLKEIKPERFRSAFYPNPITSGNSLTLEGLVPKKTATVKLYNGAGFLVLKEELPPYENASLPIHLAPGLYNLQIEQEGQRSAQKLVVR